MSAESGLPSTPDATAAVAQSQTGTEFTPPARESTPVLVAGADGFLVAPSVRRAVRGRPYERRGSDPVYRPLRIYALDPSLDRAEGRVALVNVPFERLAPGPVGAVFEVSSADGASGRSYVTVDLDEQDLLLRDGCDPSPSDPRFHAQMVYAVCSTIYAAFKRALGRDIAWGFEPRGDGAAERGERLRLRPFAFRGHNAYYDPRTGELCFGYDRAVAEPGGRELPGGMVFASLSHDIIAHEVTHALVDGLRAKFDVPSGPDVLAFHEGLADLVAIFQHFSYERLVHTAIESAGGDFARAEGMVGLARQLGHATGSDRAPRSAVDDSDPPKRYDPALEAHALGEVLVRAVFEAFTTIFLKKTDRYIRIATGGSGVLPPGRLPHDLAGVLAASASRLASQILTICIRALDYCPPVDLELGEFLRAVITADRDLVPDDPWGYRDAWIAAFRRRGIYPSGVRSLAEDSLAWRAPTRAIESIGALSFARLRFDGDPGRPASADELDRQARALGAVVADPRFTGEFGCVRPGDPRLHGDQVSLPRIHSVRSARRVGPDGQIVFDLVAEIIQTRRARAGDGRTTFAFHGGSTVILDPRGEIRYVIGKSTVSESRLERARAFVGGAGRRYWRQGTEGTLAPAALLFRLLHQTPP